MRWLYRMCLFLAAIGAAGGVAYAQQNPMDILQRLERSPNPSAPRPSSPPPPTASQAPAQQGAFDTSRYRRPQMIAGFYQNQPERVSGGTEDEVKAYVVFLARAANGMCPNVDARITNDLLRSFIGGNPNDPNAIAELGFRVLRDMATGIVQGSIVSDAMQSAVWEGDARADMTTFLSQHGCTEEVNVLLRGAMSYYKTPPSVVRQEMARTQNGVLNGCYAAFFDAGPYCRCAVDALSTLNLRTDDWNKLSSSFDAIISIRTDQADLRNKLRRCRE